MSRSGEWYLDGDCMVMNLPVEDESSTRELASRPRRFNQTSNRYGDEDEDFDPPIEPRGSFEECGRTKYMDDAARIVGGDEADMNQFPWMVALRTDWGLPFCGGTIINTRVDISFKKT